MSDNPIWGYTIRYVPNFFGAKPTMRAAGGGRITSLSTACAEMLLECAKLEKDGNRIIWARADDARMLEYW